MYYNNSPFLETDYGRRVCVIAKLYSCSCKINIENSFVHSNKYIIFFFSENNLELSISAREDYEKRATNTINGLTIAARTPQDIWRCDPKNFIKGKRVS